MKLYKRIINIFAVIVIVISIINMMLSYNTDDFASNYIAQISIILMALAIITFQQYTKYKWLTNRHYSSNYKIFVDRKKQIRELLDILKKKNSIVNIFGINGVGVSETMHFVADLINKQIPVVKRLQYYNSLKAVLPTRNIAFYFKITNINSKEQLIKELYENMFISNNKESLTMAELIQLINKKSRRRRLVLMFDEIQNNLQATLIEEFIVLYLQFRPQDTFFIGSHKKNLSYQLTYHFIEIIKFDINELYILAKAYNVNLPKNENIKLYELSQGIPAYAYLLLRYYNIEKQLCKDNLIDYLQNKILNSLNSREKEIISKLALLSKSCEEIKYISLYQVVSNLNFKELISLENRALIEINQLNKTMIILPIVADQVILNFNDNSFTTKLYVYYKKNKIDPLAIMYLLISDIKKNDIGYFNKVIDYFLQTNDMLALHNCLKLSIDLGLDMLNKCPAIYQKYSFACITMLLSCGEYKNAQSVFKEFAFNTSYFINPKTVLSNEKFNFYFLWADTKHLLNCYSEAINILDELIICEKNDYNICQLYWMKAHCLRHQWKNYNESLKYYNLCYDLSKSLNRTEYIIRSIHGMICISFIVSDEHFNYKDKFDELDKIYSETDDLWDIYKFNTWKYKSIYERIKNANFTKAEKLLNQSLNGYQKIKRRNIYDVYFEFGELYRFFGDYRQAITYYTKCYEFAQHNSDYNLQSLAQLGLILSNICLDNKIGKSSLLEELQNISINAEHKELFLNKTYSKIIIDNLNNIPYLKGKLLLFNP